MASPDLVRGAINAARRAPTQNRADVSEGMRAEISQSWKQWGKWLMSTLSQDGHLKRSRWEHGGDLCRGGGAERGPTSRLGARGKDSDRTVEDMFRRGWGVVDVMRDIFAHLMQKNEEVCRTMQKRRDTGTKKAKNVLRKKRKMVWMER